MSVSDNALPLLGKTASASTIVDESSTACAVHSGALPIFATPMMIALMECAACKCLSDGLAPGQTSVGTRISVEHTAASPIGTSITANATIEAICGRRVEFAVTARAGDREIGQGRHTRLIVDVDRFMAKVNANKEV
ncbi:MAG: thioesterase family protein [Myxococcales bacterium]|jgi:predicted thioesterase|nr:thioesterase family protein [Myxococcales bacterium]